MVTAEQNEYLKKIGCDEMQGYFASKPLPADDATRFLEAHFRKEGRRPGRALAGEAQHGPAGGLDGLGEGPKLAGNSDA